MTLNDYDDVYAILEKLDNTAGQPRSEEREQIDVVFIDDDDDDYTPATRTWLVLDASSELQSLLRTDCEDLQGGLGV